MNIKSLLISVLVYIAFPYGANAQDIKSLFITPCAENAIPIELAIGIAQQESGMNPLAINVAGESFFPATLAEAEGIIKTAHQSGKSYDVGLMQVNSYWINRWKIAPEILLDPNTNIKAGVKILSGEIARLGMTWEAVGRYHSPTLERASNYAWLIYKNASRQQNGNIIYRSSYNANSKESSKDILLFRRSGNDEAAGKEGRIIRF